MVGFMGLVRRLDSDKIMSLGIDDLFGIYNASQYKNG